MLKWEIVFLMEAKYLYVVGAFIAFVLFSVIIANNKNDTQAEPITSFYELEAKLINGEVVRMEKYKGKKILIVNVASKCGLTPQYAQLEELYNKFSEKLIVLGFPSNQFLRQEPGSNSEIASFCSNNYNISFPIFEKTRVKGSKVHAVYDWLSSKENNGWNQKAPSWNFTKYLIDENGALIKRISPRTSPISEEVISLIQ